MLNVGHIMIFSKYCCFRVMIFLANEGILLCQKYSPFYKMIVNIESNIQPRFLIIQNLFTLGVPKGLLVALLSEKGCKIFTVAQLVHIEIITNYAIL